MELLTIREFCLEANASRGVYSRHVDELRLLTPSSKTILGVCNEINEILDIVVSEIEDIGLKSRTVMACIPLSDSRRMRRWNPDIMSQKYRTGEPPSIYVTPYFDIFGFNCEEYRYPILNLDDKNMLFRSYRPAISISKDVEFGNAIFIIRN